MRFNSGRTSRKVIINACLTGVVPTKELTSFVPITPKEIIDSALMCGELGAAIVHIHPRDKDGKPTWKKEVFTEILYGIKEINPNLIISVTTSGRLWNEFEKRSECLEVAEDIKPDMASLTIGSMNFISQESINSPQMIERLAYKMKEKGIKPEIEIFEPGMIHKANYLLEKGLIDNHFPYFNIFFGSLGTSPLEPSVIASMCALLKDNAIWSFAGIQGYQLDANVIALALGGNVRLGIEDNIYFDRGKKILTTNEALIKRMTNIIKLMELDVAHCSEARQILGLNI